MGGESWVVRVELRTGVANSLIQRLEGKPWHSLALSWTKVSPRTDLFSPFRSLYRTLPFIAILPMQQLAILSILRYQ